MHDWSTGEVKSEYGLGDYKSKFETVCLPSIFHNIALLISYFKKGLQQLPSD